MLLNREEVSAPVDDPLNNPLISSGDAPASVAPVSVHYLVTRQGLIYQIGLDAWSMWHAGRTYWEPRAQGISPSYSGNYDMHGIELEHRSGQDYPPAQLAVLDWLIATLEERHHYRGMRPLGHREIAYPRGRKSDPELDLREYNYPAVIRRVRGEEMASTTNDEIMQFLRKMQADIDKSQYASSYREAITIALANGDHEEARRLSEKAAERGVVTGYRPRP